MNLNRDERLTCEVEDRVARVTMNWAPVNAIGADWLEAFNGHLDRLERRNDWAVLHIRSALKVFCAGADLRQLRGRLDADNGDELLAEDTRRIQRLFARIEALPQVSIAEIGGAAMGGGFELALSCDLRIAASEARIGLPEVGLGLLPGAGGTQRLTRLCGRGVAHRVILTGDVLDGLEAWRLGLVQWAVPLDELPERANALSMRVASMPAAALAACKSCIADADDHHRDGFASEIDATARMFSSQETRERVSAFLNRR